MGRQIAKGLNAKSVKTGPTVGVTSTSGAIIRKKQLEKSHKVCTQVHPGKMCNRSEFTTGLLYKPRVRLGKTPTRSKKAETTKRNALKKMFGLIHN